MEQLNKCPFCGGEAEITGRSKIKIICKQCGASSSIFDFKSEAIKNWNERVIVHCKDCRFYHDTEKWCDKNSHFEEDDEPLTFKPEQYCALGERK